VWNDAVTRRLSHGRVDGIVIKFKVIFGAESRTVLEGYDCGPLFFLHGLQESRVVRLAGVVETSRRRSLVQLELELAAELLAHLRETR
jgi:hypothetical protein